MARIVTVLALLTASALPATAGGDWDDAYESYHWRSEHRGGYYGLRRPYRAPAYEVYIPYYGAYFADEPTYYGSDCEVEREWRRGYYRERIDCDD